MSDKVGSAYPKVCHFINVLSVDVGDEDVFWFDIPVHEFQLMHVFDCLQNLVERLDSLL